MCVKKLLVLILIITNMTTLTSCLSNDIKSSSNNNNSDKSDNSLEMFSWWTGGGESDGLSKMFDIYSNTNPNIEIINSTVAGGAGSNAKAVLKARILGDDPPDSFQVHAGKEISTWIESDKLDYIDDLYIEEGWEDKLPQGLLDIIKIDGHYYSVPVNIHKSNVLWYNKKIFEENNLKPPKTFDDFFAVSKKLEKLDIVPLALGDNSQWADLHTFESVLLGTLGYEEYNKLWEKDANWDIPKVKESLKNFNKILDYVNEDHSALAWEDAAQMVIDEKAAMTIMGDWTEGFFKSKNFTDYGWINSPNTDGVFLMLSDTFCLPKSAKNKENAIKWLKVCGSVEGQDAFNPKKGSIPARIDAGTGDYSNYLKEAMEKWKKDKVSASVAHGAAAEEGWVTSMIDTIGAFVTTKKVDSTYDSLVKLAKKQN
jgi:glucose/mannose transport system substrate-binding protein